MKNQSRKNFFIAAGAAGCIALGFLGTTLAANINLNGGETVEFGQGVAETTSCSGSDSITVTPQSEFINEVGGGDHYFTSVSLSNIPANCIGVTFSIRAYGNSNVPLDLTDCSNDSAANLAVYFGGDSGSSQTSQSNDQMYANVIQSNLTSFTVTWVNSEIPCRSVAVSRDVQAITIESSNKVENIGDYVADYTAGSTAFVSTPLIAYDANVNLPSNSVWANGGSIQSAGDFNFSADPSTSTSSNSYVDFGSTFAQGTVGNIATTADRMTVEMWVNFNDAGGGWDGNLFSFATDDPRGDLGCGYSIAFSNGDLGVNTCNSDHLSFDATRLNNSWHHVVWIASTSARYTQKIYIDGALQHLSSHSYMPPGIPGAGENPRPNIGNGAFGVRTWGIYGQDMTVKLGALKIYQGEMSAGTVAAHASGFQSRLP